MKTLFITNHALEGNSGGVFASRAFINAFAELSSTITVLYPDNGISVTEHLSPKINLKGIKNKKNNFLKLIDIYKGKINRFQDIVVEEALKLEADLVVFDNSRSSAGSIKKLKLLGLKVITIHHNYEMEYYKACKPPIYGRMALLRQIKRCEKNAVLLSDLNLALTSEDITLLRKNYDKNNKSKFDEIGVFEYFKVREHNNLDAKRIEDQKLNFVISGTLNAEQTEKSIFPFFDKFYPLLLKNVPNCKLIITGSNPTKKLIKFCQSKKNIQLIPNPKNISDYIKDADFYICPVSHGGGLKLRILDGLKLGLPILTHKVSSRGFQKFIKSGIVFSYDDENTFEIQLLKMVNSKQDRNVNTGLYNEDFSFESGVNRLRKRLQNNLFIN
jgi:hypothetical protein